MRLTSANTGGAAMKILNISTLYPPNIIGGAELGLRTISEAMVAKGHEVHVATLQPPAQAGNSHDTTSGSVIVHPVPLANIYWPWDKKGTNKNPASRLVWHSIDTANFVMANRVAAIVREVQPEVVLTRNLQGFSTAVMPAIKKTGVPLVHVLHDLALLCPKTTLYRNGRVCGLQSQRCTGCKVFTAPRHLHTNAADAVIGVSSAVLNRHLEHGLFSNRPTQVIHNALKSELNISAPTLRNDVVTFGYLGRIEPSKGIETLLAAATRVQQQGQRCRLLIAGRGNPAYVAQLQQRWPLHDIEFCGFVETASFLRRLDLLVFPTLAFEALGNGVFEAFSQGIPVLGANTGGIPEMINRGVNGYVFEAENSQQLSGLMQLLINVPTLRSALSAGALATAPDYLAANRAAEYLAFLEKIVATQRAGVLQ
ncbi:MAG: glycosyltransferase family 4 protein [Gammaproteobacteria bacterium]|nr:glycosyltransferase family 4 protein [Gammaproteobacteria bacterium]